MEEEHIIAKLSAENIQLEKENTLLKKEQNILKSERDISIQMREKYENHFSKEIKRIEENSNVKFIEFKKIISQTEFQNPK